jgi:hypothetical protein
VRFEPGSNLRYGRVARLVFAEPDEAAAPGDLEGSTGPVNRVSDVHGRSLADSLGAAALILVSPVLSFPKSTENSHRGSVFGGQLETDNKFRDQEMGPRSTGSGLRLWRHEADLPPHLLRES